LQQCGEASVVLHDARFGRRALLRRVAQVLRAEQTELQAGVFHSVTLAQRSTALHPDVKIGIIMADIPTLAEVNRIAALRNPVVRNLQITQCYHELSAAVARRTGPHANWCTFATWASKQAGQSIRMEDLLRAIERVLAESRPVNRAVDKVTLAAKPNAGARAVTTTRRNILDALNPLAAVDRVSQSVARGNQKVFAEIGLQFARFIEMCLNDEAPNADHLAAFCAGLREGDPPEGQRFLQQAFTRYYGALFEPDKKARAELMLHANLEIGFHEQTRLQPEIKAAMEATPASDAQARSVLVAIYPTRGEDAFKKFKTRSIELRPTALDAALQNLLSVARKQLRLFLTKHMMTLWIPQDTTLNLGSDLGVKFPASLRRVSNLELKTLLKQIDPTPNSRRDSGAVDWADLPDRLHFICDFFRCYHESPDLMLPPFTDEQVAVMRKGKKPEGRL
jgi:hypothetical protein